MRFVVGSTHCVTFPVSHTYLEIQLLVLQMLEREMHDQRQSLLREIDQIRMREEALHKQEQAIHEIVSACL